MIPIYHRGSSSTLPSRRIWIVTAGVFALGVFALVYTPVRSALSRGVYFIAPTVWQAGSHVGSAVGDTVLGVVMARSLVEENRILREEMARMQMLVLDRNLLEERVRELEESLGRTSADDRVIARVLAGPGRAPYDLLVLDTGTDHGVAVDDTVVYAGTGVVGKVIEVFDTSSKVRLFSSPGERMDVLIGTTTISTFATGRGMGNFEARIPQGSVVAIGDPVTIPNGLIAGMVGAIIGDEAMPYLRILFTTPFNIAEMRTVEVIVKTKK